ncbi:MAG: protein rep [Candidatus Limivicinus sp.]
MKDITITLQKLQEKKNRGLLLAACFDRLGYEERARLVLECGTYLGMVEVEGRAKIVEANFCKQRLCPACSWRRSLRIYSTTSQILDYIDAHEQVKYLFLTLTVRNIPLYNLGKALDDMAEAFHRLTMNKAWKRRVKGCMRTLEITINRDNMTAHPHYHLILAVDRSYATKSDSTYWTYEDWKAAWVKSARLDYDPQVSIERIKGGRQKGVAEVSKYLAKDSDYLIDSMQAKMGTEEAEAATDYIVGQLMHQLHGRRLISYTGILRKAQQALRLSNPEEGPLTDTVRGDVAQAIKKYHWNTGLGSYTPGR